MDGHCTPWDHTNGERPFCHRPMYKELDIAEKFAKAFHITMWQQELFDGGGGIKMIRISGNTSKRKL